jgi:hypothetical protein
VDEESIRVTTADASLVGRQAAHLKWAKCDDRTAATAAARGAFLKTFEDQVDPEGKLSPEERTRRATSARKAHFAALARKSAAVRRARKAGEAA